jgi:streptogramin lyase
MFTRLLDRLWPFSRQRARRAQPPRRWTVLEALEDRCVPALVPPSLIITSFQEFALPAGVSQPLEITAGPDGNLWFTEQGGGIGRITPAGAVTQFPAAADGGITAGPDGNLWFTENIFNSIGRITPAGTATCFEVPTPDSGLTGITAGPDGNLWFTEARGRQIGRITPAGQIQEFLLPEGSQPLEITTGPDGNLWFTEADGIGRMLTTGQFVVFPLPNPGGFPQGITAGPDGNLWFPDGEFNQIGHITTQGVVSEEVPAPGGLGITVGPDGNLWFTTANALGRITPAGTITEFPIPTPNSDPIGITLGPDGNLWFTEFLGNRIGRLRVTILQEVTGQLQGGREAVVDLGGGRFRVRLRFVNRGGALEGPVWLVLTGLRRKVRLRHRSGLSNHLFLGSPFVDVLAPGAVLPPGGVLSVRLQFSDPAGVPIHFAAHLVDGGEASLNPQPLPPGEMP